MVRVSPELVLHHIKHSPKLEKMYYLLEKDPEVQAYLKMANVMAVGRLRYNDHGVTHSRIVAGSALEMLSILVSGNYAVPNVVKDGIGDLEDAKLVVLCGAYLHDIGNSVHRDGHAIHGYYLADRVLRRLLKKVYGSERRRMYMLKQEILHTIYSHDEEVQCLSLEAGVVKVADGTDMAEGRARVPYRTGKVDIHAVSAIAIKRVDIVRGGNRPIAIVVDMDNEAGLFQVEKVLGSKIKTSGIGNFIEVIMYLRGQEWRVIGFE